MEPSGTRGWFTNSSNFSRSDALPIDRLSDADLVNHAIEETSQQLGIHINHAETRVSRWTHAFTQYRPHHAERVAAIDGLLPRHLQLAGSSYRGIGIPACIADGTRGRGIACIDGKLNAMSRRFALTVGAVTLIVTVMSVAFFDDSDNAVTATSTTTTVAATTTTSTSTTTTSTTSTTSTTTTTTTTTTLPTPVPPPQTTGQQSP